MTQVELVPQAQHEPIPTTPGDLFSVCRVCQRVVTRMRPGSQNAPNHLNVRGIGWLHTEELEQAR